MDGIHVKITGTLKASFEKVKEEMPRVEARALYKAAYFLRDAVRTSLTTKVPKATVRNPRYNDTLVDAVGFTRVDGASLTVNALGSGRPGSGAYRARFFENDTKERFHKTRNGIPLKKKKSVGHITGTHFFADAVNANKANIEQIISDTISEETQKIFND